MSNPVAEMMDVFFNGRPAPKGASPLIRIKVTREQLRKLESGCNLVFNVTNGERVLIVLKSETP